MMWRKEVTLPITIVPCTTYSKEMKGINELNDFKDMCYREGVETVWKTKDFLYAEIEDYTIYTENKEEKDEQD